MQLFLHPHAREAVSALLLQHHPLSTACVTGNIATAEAKPLPGNDARHVMLKLRFKEVPGILTESWDPSNRQAQYTLRPAWLYRTIPKSVPCFCIVPYRNVVQSLHQLCHICKRIHLNLDIVM